LPVNNDENPPSIKIFFTSRKIFRGIKNTMRWQYVLERTQYVFLLKRRKNWLDVNYWPVRPRRDPRQDRCFELKSSRSESPPLALLGGMTRARPGVQYSKSLEEKEETAEIKDRILRRFQGSALQCKNFPLSKRFLKKIRNFLEGSASFAVVSTGTGGVNSSQR